MSLLRTQELAARDMQTWVGPKVISRAGDQTMELVQMSPQIAQLWAPSLHRCPFTGFWMLYLM